MKIIIEYFLPPFSNKKICPTYFPAFAQSCIEQQGAVHPCVSFPHNYDAGAWGFKARILKIINE